MIRGNHIATIGITIALGVLVAALVVGLRQFAVFQGFELGAYDAALRWQASEANESSPVVVIGIDENDIQRLGHYPVNDSELAALINALQAEEPAAIGIDIFRDLAVAPGTEDFYEALTRQANVIAIVKLGNDGGGVGPPPVLEGTEQTGLSELLPDDDGVVRRGVLFLDDGVNAYYSLALRLALLYLAQQEIGPSGDPDEPSYLRLGETTFVPFQSNDGGYAGADDSGYQYLLDYQSPHEFKTLSYHDVLNGELDGLDLKGRVVIIGIVAASLKDFVETPFESHAYGVNLHASATDQLIRSALYGDHPSRSLSELNENMIVTLVALLGAVIVLLVRGGAGVLLVLLGGVVVIVAGGAISFANGWWLPVVSGSAAWLISSVSGVAFLFTRPPGSVARRRPKRRPQTVVEDANSSMPKVFVSFKSQDEQHARRIYDLLTEEGIATFFSPESLEQLGEADFRREIDRILDGVKHMIVVGSTVEYITSPWVEAEWGFFINEKRSGRKSGNLITVTVGDFDPGELPPALRQFQIFALDESKFGSIVSYVNS